MLHISKFLFFIFICFNSLLTIALFRHICQTGENFSAMLENTTEYFLCFSSPILKNEAVIYFIPLDWYFLFLFLHFLFFLFYPCFHYFFDNYCLKINKKIYYYFYKNLFIFVFLFIVLYFFCLFVDLYGKLRSLSSYFDSLILVFLVILLCFCFISFFLYCCFYVTKLYIRFTDVFSFLNTLLFSFVGYSFYFLFSKSYFILLSFFFFFLLFLFFYNGFDY
jgi:hypothetical protein